MPATNLLFVIKDSSQSGVFDVFDQIQGRIKKKYTVTGSTAPTISDALQPNTILVLAAHANSRGQISFPGAMSAPAYANLILNGVAATQRAKITKIVYLVCNAQMTVPPPAPGGPAMPGRAQLAPGDTLFLVSGANLRVGAGGVPMSVKDVINLAANENGWTLTPAAAAASAAGPRPACR